MMGTTYQIAMEEGDQETVPLPAGEGNEDVE